MLFSDKLLFLHVPKTAGKSVTRFLIDNIPGDVTLAIPRGQTYRPPNLKVIDGKRHERLPQAVDLLTTLDRKLEDFDMIVSVMRNPYDLEVSYFHQKQKLNPWERGQAQNLALAGDFVEFARKAKFYGRLPASIEDWYQINGRTPSNLRILRFENLEQELYEAFERFYPIIRKLAKLDVSPHASYRTFMSPEAEEAIYRKYQWIFDNDFYPRELAAGS